MNRSIWNAGLIVAIAMAAVPPVRAQVPLQDMKPQALSPLKVQLRGYVVELQDSLVKVESIRTLIARAQASHMDAVVRSQGRQLGRVCRAGAVMAETTTQRVATMRTDDPRGERGLASFRAGLATLTSDLRRCQQDDSVTMVVNAPDPARIEQIATSASEAVNQYTQIRDGLLTLLGIDLLIKQRSAPTAN